MVLLVFLLALSSARADNVAIRAATQALDGTVWAVGSMGNDENDMHFGLFRLNGLTWQPVNVPQVEGLTGVAIRRCEDGRIYAIWQGESPDRWVISVTSNGNTRLLARGAGAVAFRGQLDIQPGISVDPSGDIWIVAQFQPVLRRISASGMVHEYPIPKTWWFHDRTTDTGFGVVELLLSTRDSKRRRWFWADSQGGYTNAALLHGVLIWDGKNLAHKSALRGIPDKPLNVVERVGETMLIGVDGAGLYRYDIVKQDANLIAPPEKEAFKSITSLTQVGSDMYCTDRPGTPVERAQVLWRQRNGRWTRLTLGLDKAQSAHPDLPDRDFVPGRTFTLAPAFGGGVWYIPNRGGPAIPADWHNGLSVDYVRRILALPSGRRVAIGPEHNVYLPDSPPRLLGNNTVWTCTTDCDKPVPCQDIRRHIWAFPNTDSKLSEWNGVVWAKHELPKNFDVGSDTNMLFDSLGRLWLLPYDGAKATAILDANAGKWTVYKSADEAYRSQASSPKEAANRAIQTDIDAHEAGTVTDGLGARWRVDGCRLIREAFDRKATYTNASDANPFLIPRDLVAAYVDPIGNTLLYTRCASYPEFFEAYNEMVIVPTRPSTAASIKHLVTTGDTLKAHIAAAGGDASIYWRLDGGKWAPVQKNGLVSASYLPAGPHSVEAIAVDQKLRFDAMPAKAECSVNLGSDQLLKALVSLLLTDGDAERETDVRHIAAFGARAIPFLRDARASANEDQRWWLDAVLQQLGR